MLGFPIEHKHKLCCLRQELIDSFVDSRYMMFIKYAAYHLQQLNLRKNEEKAHNNNKPIEDKPEKEEEKETSEGKEEKENTKDEVKEKDDQEEKKSQMEEYEAKKIVESITDGSKLERNIR